MAEIVSVIALAHAPGATGWLDRAPKAEQDEVIAGYARMAEHLRAARPDVIVGVANDHLLNFRPDNVPDWCVGLADRWQGPSAWFRDWVNLEPYSVAGHRQLAREIVRGSARRGFNLAYAEKLEFDDNWSVPLHFLTPEHDVPLVPIHMNCVMPPVPSVDRSLDFGRVLGEVLRAWPGKERIAFMATGGLSHDPGGPKYFEVDEVFDRGFMDLLAAGDSARVRRELTLDQMIAAGDGGTVELLAWLVAMGVAGDVPAETVFYVPSAPLRCGMGGMAWRLGA